MKRSAIVICLILAVAQCRDGQAGAQGAAPNSVPVMNGGAGPCSVELTVTGPDNKPVYAATVKVHLAYGFGGMRRLDLEAGTNSDGKVKFTGLPAKLKRPPAEFNATKDDLTGVASYDPASECEAKHNINLAKSKPGDVSSPQ